MRVPNEMTAVVLDGFGEADVLMPARRPVPRPETGEILIEVFAAGVNRPDILQRRGAYPAPKGAPDWPGLEVAGRVAVLGEGARRFAEGDAVMALLPGGGYADFASVAEANVLPIPPGMGMVAAAATPETFFTVWHNVFERGALHAGETLLVHGGTSGIGTVAVQLARAFDASVIATVGSDAKVEAVRRLGADWAVNYRTADFVEAALRFTEGRGVDLVLDMVGGDYANRNLRAAAPDGRIVQIAHLAGKDVPLDLGLVMTKRLTLTGSTLRPRTTAFKGAIAAALEARVWPLLAAGRVGPVIDAVFPLENAAAAHRRMEEDHVGKVVLLTARGRREAEDGRDVRDPPAPLP